MKIADTLRRLISPTTDVARPRPRSRFFRHDNSPFLFSWRPNLREASVDVRSSWVMAAARAIDTIHNSGWIAGAVDQAVASIMGSGMRLTSKPDAEALGWTPDQAKEWSRTIERRWEGWANRPIECDAEGKSSIGKLSAQALRSYFAYGEMLALLPWVRRPFMQYGTKVQLIPPSRLRQETNFPYLSQGVFRDRFGFAQGYRIDEPPEILSPVPYRDIPARDAFGRPVVVHVFDGMPGQMRGVPLITPALRVVRQFDQLSEATLTAALIQAIFAATVTSPSPTDVVLQSFQDAAEQEAIKDGTEAPTSGIEAMLDLRAGWYKGTNIDLGHHGKVAHLMPGDELKFLASQHPNDTYEAFVRFLLREIARCLGITFEQLTGDYTGATYSSVRMATSEVWLITLYRRAILMAPFLQPIFEAWLEEEIDMGWIPFPNGLDGFNANRAAAARCHWRGPAKPQADDLKFAKAIETLRAQGVVTDEWICAELGEDWLDIYEQRATEMAERKRLGLPEVVPDTKVATAEVTAEAIGEQTPQQAEAA